MVWAAHEAGAEVVVLCDTNGGMLPGEIAEVVRTVLSRPARVGIHCHNDTGWRWPTPWRRSRQAPSHVQGTANGYGERTGNANLVSGDGQPGAQARPVPSRTAAWRT